MDEVYRAMLLISKGVFGQSRNVQDGAVLSVSYLDARERTVRSVSSAMPSGFLVTETSYSNTDRPLALTSTHYRGGTAVNTLSLERKYDACDRQSEMTVRLNGAAVTSSADTYSANGRLARTAFGNPRTLQVAYSHTTRGDLASVTAPGFAQTLAYSADSCRSGNIRVCSWKGSDGIQRSYRFSYDGLNRLTRALYSESGRSTQLPNRITMEGKPDYTESIAYDISSNPVRIRRKGITEVPANALTGTLRFGLCDDITLAYSGQRLVRADDSAPRCGFSGAMDFLDGASETAEYTYDASGNMLSDSNKGIEAVTYNRLHRPQSVEVGGHTLGFVHDASGNLLQRTHRRPIGGFPPAVTLQQDIDPAPRPLYHLTDTLSYCGPFEYSHSELSRVNFPGGYVSGGKACHYIYDHQGNVRQVVDASTGHVLQENHYYPGGMLFAESSALYFKNGSYNLYRYGEKEFLTSGGLNLSLHGARMYDPALVRFLAPDPLCHRTPHLSPYLYCAANPVMLTDPTGMIVKYGEERVEDLKEYVGILKQNKFFNTYFQELENSPETFTIMFGETTYDGKSCPGYYNSETNTVVINTNNDENKNYQAIIEETFHAYQDLGNMIDIRKRNYNIEYEAKTAMLLVMLDETGQIPGLAGDIPAGMSLKNTFIDKCLQGTTFLPKNKMKLYLDLNPDYYSYGVKFVMRQWRIKPRQPSEYFMNNVSLTPEFLNLIFKSYTDYSPLNE